MATVTIMMTSNSYNCPKPTTPSEPHGSNNKPLDKSEHEHEQVSSYVKRNDVTGAGVISARKPFVSVCASACASALTSLGYNQKEQQRGQPHQLLQEQQKYQFSQQISSQYSLSSSQSTRATTQTTKTKNNSRTSSTSTKHSFHRVYGQSPSMSRLIAAENESFCSYSASASASAEDCENDSLSTTTTASFASPHHRPRRSIRAWHNTDDAEEPPVRPARNPVHCEDQGEDEPSIPTRPRFSSNTSLEVTTVTEEEEEHEREQQKEEQSQQQQHDNSMWTRQEVEKVVTSVMAIVQKDSRATDTATDNQSSQQTLPDDAEKHTRSTNSSLRDTEESLSDSEGDEQNHHHYNHHGHGSSTCRVKPQFCHPPKGLFLVNSETNTSTTPAQRAAALRKHLSLVRLTGKRRPRDTSATAVEQLDNTRNTTTNDQAVAAQERTQESSQKTFRFRAACLRRHVSISKLVPHQSFKSILSQKGKSDLVAKQNIRNAESQKEEEVEIVFEPLNQMETFEQATVQAIDTSIDSIQKDGFSQKMYRAEPSGSRGVDVTCRPRRRAGPRRLLSLSRLLGSPRRRVLKKLNSARRLQQVELAQKRKSITAPDFVVMPIAEDKFHQEILTSALAPIEPPQEFTVCNPDWQEVAKTVPNSPVITQQEFTVCHPQSISVDKDAILTETNKMFNICPAALSVTLPGENTNGLNGEKNKTGSADFPISSDTVVSEGLFGLEILEKTSADERNEKTIDVKESKKQEYAGERSLSDFSPIELQLAAKIGEDLVARYGPFPSKSSVSKQLESLSLTQRSAFNEIKDAWEAEWSLKHRRAKQPWNDEIILRVAMFADYSPDKAVDLLRRMAVNHWNNAARRVTATKLADDMKSLAVVPLPRLTSNEATDVVYICPARFNTNVNPMRLLTYAMNCLYDRHGDTPSDCRVGLLMNMEGYSFSSKQQKAFAFTDWISWMEFIQGRNGPLSVVEILLVNVSTEFKLVWKARLRSQCHEGFSWRFKFVEEATDLDKYLCRGFETSLPADLPRGQASVQKLVRDFSTYRQALEDIVFDLSDRGNVDESEDENEEAGTSSLSIDRRATMIRHASMPSIEGSKRAQPSRHRWDSKGKHSSTLPPSRPSRREMLNRSSSFQSIRCSTGSGSRHKSPRSSSSPRSASRKAATLQQIPEFQGGLAKTSENRKETQTGREVSRDTSTRSLPESRCEGDRGSKMCRRHASSSNIDTDRQSPRSSRRDVFAVPNIAPVSSSRRSNYSQKTIIERSRANRISRRPSMSRSTSAHSLQSSNKSAKNRRRHMKRTISLPSLPETIKEEEEEEDEGSLKVKSILQLARSNTEKDADSVDSVKLSRIKLGREDKVEEQIEPAPLLPTTRRQSFPLVRSSMHASPPCVKQPPNDDIINSYAPGENNNDPPVVPVDLTKIFQSLTSSTNSDSSALAGHRKQLGRVSSSKSV